LGLLFEKRYGRLEMPTTQREYINMSSHKRFFKFVNSDKLLNEFIWRADTGLLAFHVHQELQKHGYNVAVRSRVSINTINSGVFIFFEDLSPQSNPLWHISFHLEKWNGHSKYGAIHIKNNVTGMYQLLYITRMPSICSPLETDSVILSRGSIVQNTMAGYTPSQFCGAYKPSIDIVLHVLNNYFTPDTNPLSLHNDLSNVKTKHPYLLTVMASRPANIAVSGLIGGKTRCKKQSKSKHTRKYRYKQWIQLN
jgi:hypothetical protein